MVGTIINGGNGDSGIFELQAQPIVQLVHLLLCIITSCDAGLICDNDNLISGPVGNLAQLEDSVYKSKLINAVCVSLIHINYTVSV
jgi:hypothetical protein